MARRVSTKTGASAPSKGFKTATGKGRGGAAAGPGSRKPEQKPQVVAFNESTVDAINKSGPPGHEVAHINPREGRLLKALGGSGKKDPETNIKSYEVVGDKKGKDSPKLPKGKGRGRFPGYKGNEHQVAVLTDPEVEALNTLRYKDKDRGYTGGFGPEIQALAAQNDRPFEYLEYRGEKIPTLNGGEGSYGGGESGSYDSGQVGGGGNLGDSDSQGGNNDWYAKWFKEQEEIRIKKEKEKKEKAEKIAKEKAEKEAKELAEKKEKERLEKKAKDEMKEKIAAAEREEKRREEKIKKEKEKALERKEKREAKELAEKEALEAEEAEVMSTIEEEADEAAELDLEGKNQDIGTEYDFDFDKGDRIGGPVVGMDGYVWQAPSSYGGASDTPKYEPVKEEDFTPTTDDIDNISYFDPDEPLSPEEDDFEPGGEGGPSIDENAPDPEDDESYDSSQDDPSGEAVDYGEPDDDDTDTFDSDAKDDFDDSLEGFVPADSEKDSETLEEEAEDDASELQDLADNPDDDDTDTFDSNTDSFYDPNADDDDTDLFDSNEDAGGTTTYDPYAGDSDDDLGNLEGDPTLDPDGSGGDDPPIVIPDDNDDDDPTTGDHDTGDGTGDDDGPTGGGDQEKLLEELEEQYAEYGETDYEKLYQDEFSDDLEEDWRASRDAAERAFLMSGDLSEFNTKGNTVNDQLLALEESLGGDQQDYLDEMSANYATGPKKAIQDWYKKQKAAILDGTIDSLEPLDLSEWADPSEKHDPEFFKDVEYSKLYETDPVAEDISGDYYDPESQDPHFNALDTDLPTEEDASTGGSYAHPGSVQGSGGETSGVFNDAPYDDFHVPNVSAEDETRDTPPGFKWQGNKLVPLKGTTLNEETGEWDIGDGDTSETEIPVEEGDSTTPTDPNFNFGGVIDPDEIPDEIPDGNMDFSWTNNLFPSSTEAEAEPESEPEIVEPKEEEIVPIKHETDPNYGAEEPEPEEEWTIDEHIINDPDNPVGDESSDYDDRYEGMSEDEIYEMVDLYNEENELLPGDDGYRYGEDEIALEHGAEVKDPDEYSFQDQIDAYNIGMGLNPGDPDYMYAPETEDTGTDLSYHPGSKQGSGGGSDSGDTQIAYTPGTTTTLTTAPGIEHTQNNTASSEPIMYGGGGDNFHYGGGGSGGGSGGSGMDFDFSGSGGADMSAFEGQDEFYDTNTFDPGNPDAWMQAPTAKPKVKQISNKTKPLKPWQRNQGGGGGGSYSHYGPGGGR